MRSGSGRGRDGGSRSLWRLAAAAAVVLLHVVPGVVARGREAAEIRAASGFVGGFAVHVGCGDGDLLAELVRDAPRVDGIAGGERVAAVQVHGLDTSAAAVAAARARLVAAGMNGPASADHFDGMHLPYVDGLVNLLVVEATHADRIAAEEIDRVLCPRGVALIRGAEGWTKRVRPWPVEMDEWTHYFHDASGNPVAHDTLVGPPRSLQWVGSPRWSRHHDRMASLTSMVSANGRLYMIQDEGSRTAIELPAKWRLLARDAFNGTPLWSVPIPVWHDHMWPLKSGPTQLTRRLVALGDDVFATLGLHAPIVRLDGRTGRVVREYADTVTTEEIILDGGVLVLLVNRGPSELDTFRPAASVGDQGRVEREFLWNEQPREVRAIEPESGRVLWTRTGPVVPLTLCANAGAVAWHDGERIVCVERSSGEERWASAPAPRRQAIPFNFGPRLVMQGEVVLYAGGEGRMRGYATADGRQLWETEHAPSGYQSPQDLMVSNGLVWVAPTTSSGDSGIYKGRDILTGEVKVEFPPDVDTYWFHHRCSIAKGTDRFLIPSRTGIEFVDTEKRTWDTNHWVRGGCLYGVLPCNGLLYAPPHDCACYPETKLSGFNALAAQRAAPPPRPADDARLTRGPAFDGPFDAAPQTASDWPTYRHDAARSGASPDPLPGTLDRFWEVAIGGRLSQPVVVADTLYVAQVDAHAIHAIDVASGGRRWSFTAGGRIDSPPTIWQGRVLFGSADGAVYCLRASDGALAWRFFAAPSDRRLMALEQLESVWPVHGTVLVVDDLVHVVVGRSCFLDDGMQYVRLDPRSGAVVSRTILDDRDPETGGAIEARIAVLQMPAGLADILSFDGERIFLRSQAFDRDGRRVAIGPVSGDAARQGSTQAGAGRHLYAPTGFLDDTWFHRSYWVYGRNFAGGHNGYWQAGKYTPAGRILAFNDTDVFGYARQPQYYKWTTPLEHQLFAAGRDAVVPEPVSLPPRRGGAASAPVVSFQPAAAIDPRGVPVTVEAWVRPEKPNGTILAHGGAAQGYALAIEQRRPVFRVRSNQRLGTLAADIRLADGWNHVVGMLAADGTLRLFLDGREVAAGPGPGLLDTPKTGLDLGGDTGSVVGGEGSDTPLAGALDEVRIFHRELTAAEIAAAHADPEASRRTLAGAVLALTFDAGNARDTSGAVGGVAAAGLHDLPTGKGRLGSAVVFPSRTRAAAAGGGPAGAKAGPGAEAANGLAFDQKWTRFVPIFARGMVLGRDALLVAGPPDLVDSEEALRGLAAGDAGMVEALARQDAALGGAEGGRVSIVSLDDGSHVQSLEVDFLPVFDGVIAAAGRIYASTTDGRIVCHGPRR